MTCRVLCALSLAFVCATSPAAARGAPAKGKSTATAAKMVEKASVGRVPAEKAATVAKGEPGKRAAPPKSVPSRPEPNRARKGPPERKRDGAVRASVSASRSRAKSDTLAERLRSDEAHARPEPTARLAPQGKSKAKDAASPARPKRRVRPVPLNASWREYRRQPWRRGHVTLFGHGKRWSGYLVGPEGEVPPASRKSLSRVLASWRTGKQILIDEHLIRLIADVSDEFGGRPIRIVSGYREHSYAHDSKHKTGEAFDFSVPGVPNAALRDFLRSLGRVGVGYYPNSTHVHLDVRDKPTYWVDHSFPGLRPAYATDRRVARWSPRERAIADAIDAIRLPAALAERPAPAVPMPAPMDRKPAPVPAVADAVRGRLPDRTRAVAPSADAGAAALDAGAARADGGARTVLPVSGGNADAGDGAPAAARATDYPR